MDGPRNKTKAPITLVRMLCIGGIRDFPYGPRFQVDNMTISVFAKENENTVKNTTNRRRITIRG